jgi:hypothetical protein
MQKTSGKKVRGVLIIRNGKIGIRLDSGQELGKSCHKINDILLPGTAINRQMWEDAPKDPDDYEHVNQQQQI